MWAIGAAKADEERMEATRSTETEVAEYMANWWGPGSWKRCKKIVKRVVEPGWTTVKVDWAVG